MAAALCGNIRAMTTEHVLKELEAIRSEIRGILKPQQLFAQGQTQLARNLTALRTDLDALRAEVDALRSPERSHTRPKLIPPTDEEKAAIQAGIAADPDTGEVSDEEFASMRPREWPAGGNTTEEITLHLDRDLIEVFRSRGEGWEIRISEALREWVNSHEAW
jgi:uncharacterized protein (DUF4415 family)